MDPWRLTLSLFVSIDMVAGSKLKLRRKMPVMHPVEPSMHLAASRISTKADAERALQEIMENMSLSYSMVEYAEQQQPIPPSSACPDCITTQDPDSISFGTIKAIYSASDPGKTVAFFVLLVLSGLFVILWISRRRRIDASRAQVVALEF